MKENLASTQKTPVNIAHPDKDVIVSLFQATFLPSSTYRLQLNPEFRFEQAAAIVPYLHQLGISTLYLSPIFQAAPGSTHGYNVTNPNRINPELGGEEGFHHLQETAKSFGISLILDIVPNHMGISGNNNDMWLDVLENGQSSSYAAFFDIDWNPEKKELKDKVLVPFLGSHYGAALENQDIQLAFENGSFLIRLYNDRGLPIAPETYPTILSYQIEQLEEQLKADLTDYAEYLSIMTAFRNLPPRTEKISDKVLERSREKEVAKSRLGALAQKSSVVSDFIRTRLDAFNGRKEEPKSFNLLDQLLNEQVYRLADWHVASEEINYRRFFDINELAAIRMEDPAVFTHYHRLIFRLLREEKIQGLRIDHADGLYDPANYFRRLQKQFVFHKACKTLGLDPEKATLETQTRLSELSESIETLAQDEACATVQPLYVVIEKILDRKEALPEGWKVHGTVGYDFAAALDSIFVDPAREKDMTELYESFIGYAIDFDQLVYDKKKFFALTHMSSEIYHLAHRLNRISETNRRYRDFTLNNMTVAIRETIACFPVYRTYLEPNTRELSERDAKYIHIAIEKAKRKTPALPHALYDFLRDILLLNFMPAVSESEEELYRDFALRFQQLTGPVMAKGYEDTAFYVYNRLISLNEVGSNPVHFGSSVSEFHRQNMDRNKKWPASLLATSTHDTKRSEDVRMRLHALSEMPEEWKTQVTRWNVAAEKFKTALNGTPEPRRNTEYFIYQTLLGAWPNETMDEAALERFRERVLDYLIKATREAKIFTSWMNPETEYEDAVKKFVSGLLSSGEDNHFLKLFLPFQKKISRLGMLNSLSALVLKIGSPGVPDLYQGNELWHYCLVDPDNRRNIDFENRTQLLKSELSGQSLESLAAGADFDPLKLLILSRGLNFRRRHEALLVGGDYVTLRAEGKMERHAVAFARKKNGSAALIACARFFNELISDGDDVRLKPDVWGDTRILIPQDLVNAGRFRDALSGRELTLRTEGNASYLNLDELFQALPVIIATSDSHSAQT